jgi:histidine phosphotransferase ChpT
MIKNFLIGSENMEIDSPLHLAELLTSRLCHDLITPIGAINAGLELFQETLPGHHTESDEILNLILSSAHTASARVSFYRVAFGNGAGKISLGVARELIEKYFMRSKLKIEWNDSFQKDFVLDKWERILLNSVLWMSECAPRGGLLRMSLPREGHPSLSLCLKADSIILHQGTLEAIEGKSLIRDITPRTVPCYLIHCIVKKENGKLMIKKIPSTSELILEVTMQ